MPCVHYKFSSLLHYDTVTFSGLNITLGDLKRQIMGRQKLKVANCELQIMNAQTREGAWGRQARGLGHCPAGGGRGLREPHSALCGLSPRGVSQPGARPAGVRGTGRASGASDSVGWEGTVRFGHDQ